MPPYSEDTSFQDRLMALKMLRENMFYGDPETYGYTDIAEDLPGRARAFAPMLKNVLPSAAIISNDPAERNRQIDEAIVRLKQSRKSKGQLLQEVKHNLTELVPATLKGGALLSALIPLIGFRTPWGRDSANKLRPRMPTDFIGNTKKLFTDPAFRKNIAEHTVSGAMQSALLTAATGTMLPLIAGNYELSDKALQEAKSVLQENPYLTSLPASEILAALKTRKSEQPLTPGERFKNILTGAGIGLATALPGAVVPTGFKLLGRLGRNTVGAAARKIPATGLGGLDNFISQKLRPLYSHKAKGLTHGLKTVGRRGMRQDLYSALGLGAGLGALSGALSNNVLGDEYEAVRPNQT